MNQESQHTIEYNAARNGDISYWSGRENFQFYSSRNTLLHAHLMNSDNPNADFIYEILKSARGVLDVTNQRGELIYHVAAEHGHVEAMEILLFHEYGGLRYLRLPNMIKLTPVHLALQHKKDKAIEFIDLFLEVDREKNFTDGLFDEHALKLAMYKNSPQLVEKICLGRKSSWDTTLLHQLISPETSDMVITILKFYPLMSKKEDNEGRRLVHIAAERKDNLVLEKILEMYPDYVSCFDKSKQIAVHKAAHHDNLAGLQLIERLAPDTLMIVDAIGYNIAHHAVKGHSWEVLQYILDNPKHHHLLIGQDRNGNTAFHLLAFSLKKMELLSLQSVHAHIFNKLRNHHLSFLNNDYQTAGDIAHSFLQNIDTARQNAVKEFCDIAPRGMKVYDNPRPNKVENTEEIREIKKLCFRCCGGASFIATLAFSAILSPPGGFNQNDGDPINRGTVMLRNNTAFEVCSTCNRGAWALSATSIVFYSLVIALVSKLSVHTLKFLCFVGLILTTISVAILMVANVASVYATEEKSGGLLFKLLITLVPMFLCMLFVMYSFYKWKRLRGKKEKSSL